MTMKPLPRFWKALDALPGAATDRRDWTTRLGAELPLAQTFLRATGRRVTAIDCPSPGDDGCPRAVIKSAGGALRAVCRSATGRCDPLDLQPVDTDILQVDFVRLRHALAAAFDVQMAGAPPASNRVALLGEHAIAAGVAAPVMLVAPGPMDGIQFDDLREGGLGSERAVLLVPTATSLRRPLRARLSEQGHHVIPLSDIVLIERAGVLQLAQPIDILLHDVRAALQARLGAARSGPRVALPPGTTWGQVTLRCTSSETVICTAPGVSRQMDPGDFDMRSAKNAKPIAAWTFFMLLAMNGGILKIDGRAIPARARKQKEALSRHLQETFRIVSDPIAWDARQQAYVAAFVVRDERPKQERERWLRDLAERRRR
ncbi:hypothetical protein [Falsiroseomonas oryzae]|uniref:hypothetical protein n=1 Tax=Falsiroseomonas oryzae TaxID=2766473 RepID=UPI0022EB40CB|nr:hypothetical protein [Roseomonas sp. MO-31]